MKRKKIITVITAAVLSVSLFLSGCKPYSAESEAYAEGIAALGNDDYEKALEAFKTAAEEDGITAEGYRGIGIAYLKQGNYKYAVSFLDISLKEMKYENPEFREDVLWYKADALIKDARYDESIEVYTELTQMGRPGLAYAYRGKAHLIAGDAVAAEKDFSAAAEAENSYDVCIFIYEAYREVNLENNGSAYLEKALEIEPSGAKDYQKLGRIYDYLEDDQKAEEYLMKAIEAGDEQAVPVQADIYIKNGHIDEAKALYFSKTEKGKASAADFNGLAICFIASGEYDTALQYIAQGLEIANEEEKRNLLYNEIVCYEKKLDFETAGIKAEEYLQIYPTDIDMNREITFLSR